MLKFLVPILIFQEKHCAALKIRFRTAFAYAIGGRHFVYGQEEIRNEKRQRWAIYELLPNQQFGAETDSGSWLKLYRTLAPFSIDGRQFFFAQNRVDKNMFIQELLEGGKLGAEITESTWTGSFPRSFAIEIAGRHYLFCHGGKDVGYKYHIAELFLGGYLNRTDVGAFDGEYKRLAPFTINSRHFFYAYNIENNKYFIREILPGGKLGDTTMAGIFNHTVGFTFIFELSNKHFLYSQSWKEVVVYEIRPGGLLGNEILRGTLCLNGYAIPFKIKGNQYVLQQRNLGKACIHQLV